MDKKWTEIETKETKKNKNKKANKNAKCKEQEGNEKEKCIIICQ